MKFTVGKKITFGFLFIIVLLLFLGFNSYRSLTTINASYSDLVERSAIIMENAANIRYHATNQVSLLRGLLVDPTDIENIEKVKSENEKIHHLIEETETLVQKEEYSRILADVKELNEQFKKESDKALETFETDTEKERESSIKEIIPIGLDIRDRVGVLVEDQMKDVESGTKENAENVKKEMIVINAISLIAVLFAIAVSVLISRMISKPLVQMKEQANIIASGDLTVEEIKVKNKDEIGELAEAFNAMTLNLKEVIDQVSMNTHIVASSSEQLMASAEQSSLTISQVADSMQNVAAGADRQVEVIEETSQIIQDMSSSINQISENAKQAGKTTDATSEKAKTGRDTLEQVIRQMNSIEKTVGELSQVITRLGDRSNEIGKIIEVITGIANETNLLSLNAAIEAARAGEQGRGFAVVADEVRKLAEQSALSAKQISELISSIQNETKHAVDNMSVAKREVSGGMDAVHTADHSFEDIQTSIEEVNKQISDVSRAVGDISEGAKQVVESMEHLNQVSEESSVETQSVTAATEEQMASMEEITQSVTSLSQMAQELKTAVERFKR